MSSLPADTLYKYIGTHYVMCVPLPTDELLHSLVRGISQFSVKSEIQCFYYIIHSYRVKAPVVDHVSVVDYCSEKHEKYGF